MPLTSDDDRGREVQAGQDQKRIPLPVAVLIVTSLCLLICVVAFVALRLFFVN